MRDTVTMPDKLPPSFRSWNEFYYAIENKIRPGIDKVTWIEWGPMDTETKEHTFSVNAIKANAFEEIRRNQLTKQEAEHLLSTLYMGISMSQRDPEGKTRLIATYEKLVYWVRRYVFPEEPPRPDQIIRNREGQ